MQLCYDNILYRIFRRRFRVPFPVFEHIVSECNRVNLFNIKSESRVRIPTEFKVLISLRILGRGNCFDDISEMSNVFQSSVAHIFHVFVTGFVEHFYEDHVSMPTGERLVKVKRMYEQLGLPGCKGSMDCTHIPWDKCPFSLKNLCTGKEKVPTLSFNCIVDHTRMIHHCSRAFAGASNDITVCHNDDPTTKYMENEYADEE
jgi:hypothetical protein